MTIARRANPNPLRHTFLLILAALLRPRVPFGSPPDAQDRILLIRPDHLGDQLFVTPALRRLRARFPKAFISYLVGPWAAPVVTRNPHVDEILYCEFPWFDGRSPASPWQPYLLLLSWAKRLRTQGFAAVVNLRFDFWWGAALGYLARIPYRLGYDVADCRPFLHPIVPYTPGRHEVVQNVLLLDHLAESASPPPQPVLDALSLGPLEFPLSPDERAFATAYLAAHGITTGQPFVAIHPGTRGLAKRWPEDRFAAVATTLSRRLGSPVLITGSAAERPLVAAIARHTDAATIDAAGETSVGELAALFARAALVIGVDSGPLHLAAALGRPTIHLYGPSDHVSFAPYGDAARHHIVRAELECSPCHRFDWPPAVLPDHDCMSSISVEQVLQAAERVLACPDAALGGV